jgi:hypothetical protein
MSQDQERRRVTVTESLFVKAPPEAVWDFTQDYARRHEWDRSILEARVVEGGAAPRVAFRAAGGVSGLLQYKQFARPRQTSLAMEEVKSWLVEGGGGSWSYEAKDGGTLWTQTNGLIVKPGWWRRLLLPMVATNLRTATRAAMHRARELLEPAPTGGAAPP